LALRWFTAEQDRHMKHAMGTDLRQLLEKQPDPDVEVRPSLSLYGLGPCSKCREFTVHRLIELHALPEEVRRECQFDANEAIRDLITAPRK
jgi:hypothetical protein